MSPALPPHPFDPADWDTLRSLGHRMVDDMMGHLEKIGDQPVWSPVPADVVARLSQPLPEKGVGAEQAYATFLRDVFPYPVGNIHPRFWGWVNGSGTPLGALAEMLAATMNPNVAGHQGSPRHVEDQVLVWLAELLGYPREASGLLVSGGSMANFVGLAAALVDRAGFDLPGQGMISAPKRPVLYASTETHFSVDRALRLLGVGDAGHRRIPVTDRFQIDLAALRATIAADRNAGHHPVAVVGNAGTVGTGAFDDLDALATLAADEGLWFHVDGAFGAFAAVDPGLAPLVRGMERADSLAFDLHKWMVVPIEAGAVFVRNGESHRRAFRVAGDYVTSMEGGIGVDVTAFAERGVQLTRGFRALKVWMSLLAHGAEAYRSLIRGNVKLARHLDLVVSGHPSLELLTPTVLNVVCFRYRPEGVPEPDLDDLNRRILVRLHEEGIAAPSYTTLGGRYALRVCITNHRSTTADLDALVVAVTRLGTALVA